MTLVFLLEERSMKEFLDILLPKILPENVGFRTIPHEGKSDLEKSIKTKLVRRNRAGRRAPDAAEHRRRVRERDPAVCFGPVRLRHKGEAGGMRKAVIRTAGADRAA